MKTHTNDFKNNIKTFGREIDAKITYTLNSETIELGAEELNSVVPHYEGAILKSVMKQLDLDSNVDMPLNTVLNVQFGVKVGNSYEYINFGNYVVYSSEKQEDTSSWKITCYDKMLYSMKNYAGLTVSYPITIRNYLASICSYLGIGFANASDTFANYDKEIEKELYLGQGYTFRDVLDEIAQATASTICINNSDNLEIRYITDTSDTIDEDFLKDVNVNFGKKYGPINSIVLSRSAESDNVYLRDDESIEENGLCEIKIVDNQIMNWNDRADYLEDILDQLDGLEYYLNDFSSPGITYYDLCDRYNVSIGENTYSCVMLNDEINITQGLEENIHTDMPSQGETDYTKADKTDRRIDQVYLIVDKQNGTIESLVSAVGEQSTQISTLSQSVNQISARVEDVNDGTVTGVTSIASVNLEKVAEGSPYYIQIYPIINDIARTYPYKSLYPSATTYLKIRKLRFTNTTTNATFDYEIPYDLFYLDENTYDEFVLDSENESCYIKRRVGFDANDDKYKLSQEQTVTLTYPSISLTAGNYTVELLGYTSGYIKVSLNAVVKWATKAELAVTAESITSSVSSTYATKTELGDEVTELNSTITQTAGEINLEVAKKVNTSDYTGAKIVAKINDTGSSIQIEADHIDLTGKTIALTSDNINITSTYLDIATNGTVSLTDGGSPYGILPRLKITDGNGVYEAYMGSASYIIYKNNVAQFYLSMASGYPSIVLTDGTNTTTISPTGVVTT